MHRIATRRIICEIICWRRFHTVAIMATPNGSSVGDLPTSEEILSVHPPPPVNGEEKGWFDWLPSWKPTSEETLIQAEKMVLNDLKSEYSDQYIIIADNTYIRTLSMTPEEVATGVQRTPLVMVHGFGCGLAAFYKNYDSLHSKRHLYAFDILGFGRSSRTAFSRDPEEIENQFVESIEKWRKAIGLEKFILLGHSLGAFISTSYAMKYPERVRHLVLVDTWGFVEKPDETEVRQSGRYRVIVPFVQYYVSVFNPFSVIRALGPYGPTIFSRFRKDLQEKFGEDFVNYVYHCNAQIPSGENAYSYMQLPIAYSKRPMLSRLDSLSSSIPISMLYGTRSWFDNSTGEKVFSMRPNSFVDIHYLKGAGHHMHAELPEIFNRVVNGICEMVDKEEDSVKVGVVRDEQDVFHSY